MKSKELILAINWKGPYEPLEVIENMTDGGFPPDYDGEDYGLYQIYGTHILNEDNTLLYVGKALKQKFSTRLLQHRPWLERESNVSIYLGRACDPQKHSEKDNWQSWTKDLEIAEALIIHKYTPNYNSSSISKPPPLEPYTKVHLIHKGKKYRLKKHDYAPDDW